MIEQLRGSQKLELDARLAGGIAHDLNNLLTAILGYSELLERRLDVGDPGRRDTAAIRDSAEKARDLTSRLLAFGRAEIVQPETLESNAVLGEQQEATALLPERERQPTVLLLEDDQVVRTLVREVLEHDGFKVLEAETAAQALDLAGRNSGIDVLLTDVVMPTMSGPQVAAELARTSPELKVVFMSGYTDEAVLRHGAFDGKTAFIQKPFTTAELTAKVRSMLDE